MASHTRPEKTITNTKAGLIWENDDVEECNKNMGSSLQDTFIRECGSTLYVGLARNGRSFSHV